MPRITRLCALLGIGALGGCGGERLIPPPLPRTMTIVAGNAQSANTGEPLQNQLQVAVTTPDGAGVRGVVVGWQVTAGGGSVDPVWYATDDQGRASAIWTLGNAAGTQSVTAAATGVEGSPVEFSATATRPPKPPVPIVLHYDGTTWSTALEEVYISLVSVWGASPSVLFAVGNHQCGGPLLLRHDGTSWSGFPGPCPGNPQVHLPSVWGGILSVWGSTASDVFYVGRVGRPINTGPYIYHYDGQQWKIVYNGTCPVCQGGPRAVWSSSRTDAFFVGANIVSNAPGNAGLILRYDGTTWTQQAIGTTEPLAAVWGVGASGPVFAVGANGTILYYDRSTWRSQASGTTRALHAVWGTSANDVFAVGEAGTILHYDGTTWTAQNSGSTQPLYGIWGSSANSVFAVGDAGTILHYDGTRWAAHTNSATINLRGVWGRSATDVFAVGGPP